MIPIDERLAQHPAVQPVMALGYVEVFFDPQLRCTWDSTRKTTAPGPHEADSPLRVLRRGRPCQAPPTFHAPLLFAARVRQILQAGLFGQARIEQNDIKRPGTDVLEAFGRTKQREDFMRRLLLCSGVHGERRSLETLCRLAAEQRPEAILFAGGILSQQREAVSRSGSLWGLTLEDERFVHEFCAALGGLGVFSAVIPGPNFQPMDDFYRLGLAFELEFPHVHWVHATLVEERDLAVCGLGVVIAEQALRRGDSWSRVRALYYLRPLRTSAKPRKVLLLPEPPPGVLGGPEGNVVIEELIDSLHPSLCVVAGPTERRGLQRIANTLVVNPGSLADDSAALLDWDRKENDQVEFLGT